MAPKKSIAPTVSAELEDLRAKVTPLAHHVLNSYAQVHGIDKTELVRDILDKWASRQVHAASVITKTLQREGIAAENEGIGGRGRE